jgi:hypothetical protein
VTSRDFGKLAKGPRSGPFVVWGACADPRGLLGDDARAPCGAGQSREESSPGWAARAWSEFRPRSHLHAVAAVSCRFREVPGPTRGFSGSSGRCVARKTRPAA